MKLLALVLAFRSVSGVAYGDLTFQFTQIDATSLGATNTFAYGINNSGQIVGQYVDAQGNLHGFETNGTAYTTVDYPVRWLYPCKWHKRQW